jgi:hypothetical protein
MWLKHYALGISLVKKDHEGPDKIGFEPMVLGSTLTFKVSTFDHSVIYPRCIYRLYHLGLKTGH